MDLDEPPTGKLKRWKVCGLRVGGGDCVGDEDLGGLHIRVVGGPAEQVPEAHAKEDAERAAVDLCNGGVGGEGSGKGAVEDGGAVNGE